MYNIEIDKMIMEALKAGQKVKAGAYRMLKAEFLVAKTAKNAKPLDEAAEISIIKKMIKQRQDAAKEYMNAGRLELADNELDEVEVLKALLPAEITEAQINEAIAEIAEAVEPIKKNMGLFMKGVKAKYPTADGKLVSELVGKYLN